MKITFRHALANVEITILIKNINISNIAYQHLQKLGDIAFNINAEIAIVVVYHVMVPINIIVQLAVRVHICWMDIVEQDVDGVILIQLQIIVQANVHLNPIIMDHIVIVLVLRENINMIFIVMTANLMEWPANNYLMDHTVVQHVIKLVKLVHPHYLPIAHIAEEDIIC